jgi:glycosyltransferase involved in cell wall biosynthesis
MRATAAKPFIGKFVRDQRDALESIFEGSLYYFEMPETRFKQIKYIYFFYNFFLFMRKKHFSIIHVHFYFPTIIAPVLYKLIVNRKCRILVTFHGSDVFLYSKRNKIYCRLLKYVDRFIFVSKGLNTAFVEKFGAINKPVNILCAGINSMFFQTTYIGNQEKLYDLVFIGTIDKNKGAERLHHILTLYPDNLRVLIVGRGPKENLFKVSFPIQHKITIAGSLGTKEVIKALQQSKYLINLSHNESFGLVLSESMAVGTPVIATETYGSLEQVIHDSNGFLIPQEQASFESTSLSLIKYALELDENHYAQLVKNAQDTSQQYNISNISNKIAVMYKTELEQKN